MLSLVTIQRVPATTDGWREEMVDRKEARETKSSEQRQGRLAAGRTAPPLRAHSPSSPPSPRVPQMYGTDPVAPHTTLVVFAYKRWVWKGPKGSPWHLLQRNPGHSSIPHPARPRGSRLHFQPDCCGRRARPLRSTYLLFTHQISEHLL